MYTVPENINYDEGDLIDPIIPDMPSKFILINTAPDFGKAEDPFASLGPIAVRTLKWLFMKTKKYKLLFFNVKRFFLHDVIGLHHEVFGYIKRIIRIKRMELKNLVS